MSADPLRERVDHEVRAVVEGAEERRRRERGVHDERKVVAVRNLRVLLDVRDVKGRVADGLDEEKPSLLVNRCLDSPEVVDGREVRLDADVRQDGVELAERAAVEVARRHDLVACAGDVGDGEVDGRRAARKGLGRRAALKRRDALGEDVVRGVHEPRVDVAEFPESEEVGAVLGVAEVVGRGPIDWHGARLGGGVAERLLPCVNRQRLDVVFPVAHFHSPFVWSLSCQRGYYRIDR